MWLGFTEVATQVGLTEVSPSGVDPATTTETPVATDPIQTPVAVETPSVDPDADLTPLELTLSTHLLSN